MKSVLPLIVLLTFASAAFAQNAKKNPPPRGGSYEPWQVQIKRPDGISVPSAAPTFGTLGSSIARQPLPALQPSVSAPSGIKITRDKNGMPIAFRGTTAASGSSSSTEEMGERALQYLASLQPSSIKEPLSEFVVSQVKTDDQGNAHVRLQQMLNGVPVYGAEVIAHTQKGAFAMLNGRYYPTPEVGATTPVLDAARAIERVKTAIGTEKVKTNWTSEEMQLIDGQPFTTELVIYHTGRKLNAEHLAWHIVAHPNILSREVYFVDAITGEILHHFDNTCNLVGHRHEQHNTNTIADLPTTNLSPTVVDGPVTASGTDLLNVNRSFGAWQVGSQFVLQDASKPMFNSGASSMPNDPVGAIITLNAGNTSPETQSSFDYSFVVSNGTSFNNATAVSGHWNSIKSYDYYKNTFNRNGIDGVGGNIIAFVNVSDGDGSSMENAYWNGAAMWYGNGGSIFKQLARGLDVGGHEMTHGVVEKTANLEYQDESGAMNESFADVFGVMIDRDDWKIGEDVMQSGVNPSNALRDLQDPHNGVSSNSPWWQPSHTNEQYSGSEDNGGVHINSGIPNHAFYLFATNAAVGKDKAEQVFYKALDDYLVKSSQFVDLRIAVVQAATDLYGSSVANAAGSAFAAVGIGDNGGQPSGNYLGQLATNPGDDLILCVSNDKQNLDIALGDGTVLGSIYTDGVRNRPSISDNGSQVAFVNAAGDIILVDLVYTPTQIIPTVNPPYSAEPIWRNVAISKDGAYLAAITEMGENKVYIADLTSALGDTYQYFLYNPTYSQNTITGEVQYADVLEFDYSGQNLMYDAYNELTNGSTDLSYWDIGFLEFRKNGNFVTGPNPAFISKLFSGIPENTSIGDPAFAKNSPFIIAFDFFNNDGSGYDIYGANTETGDYGQIIGDNGDLGWPNYTRLDNALLFHSPDVFGDNDIYLQGLASSKIAPQGNETLHVTSRQLGVWYATGNRNLQVGTSDLNVSPLAISVSPNPTTDRIHVQLDTPESGSAQVEIRDLLGKLLQIKTVQLSAGNNQFDLDVQNLPTGTYILRCATDNTGAAVKIVKQ